MRLYNAALIGFRWLIWFTFCVVCIGGRYNFNRMSQRVCTCWFRLSLPRSALYAASGDLSVKPSPLSVTECTTDSKMKNSPDWGLSCTSVLLFPRVSVGQSKWILRPDDLCVRSQLHQMWLLVSLCLLFCCQECFTVFVSVWIDQKSDVWAPLGYAIQLFLHWFGCLWCPWLFCICARRLLIWVPNWAHCILGHIRLICIHCRRPVRAMIIWAGTLWTDEEQSSCFQAAQPLFFS